RPGLRHRGERGRDAGPAAAGDRGPGHRAARPDAAGSRRVRAVPPDPRAVAYMPKPFSIEELLARIAATLRRTRPAAPTEQQASPVIVVGDIVIDLALQQVTRNGQPFHLTPTEFALLRELAVNRGKLLTH